MNAQALLAQRREMQQEIEQLRKERDEHLAQLGCRTRERDAAIADGMTLLAERDAALAERDQARAELEESEKEGEHALRQLDKALTERDAALADLSQVRAEVVNHQNVRIKVEFERDQARAERDEARDYARKYGRETSDMAGKYMAAVARAEAAEAALQMANDDVRQLRLENARTKLRLSISRELHSMDKALLGRAVAALQEARGEITRMAATGGGFSCSVIDDIDAILADPSATAAVEAMRAQQEEREALPQPAHIRCPWCDTRHLDIGEWEMRPHHKHKCAACQKLFRVEGEHGEYFYGINDDDHYAGAGHDIAKVDARRDGK